jgi:hypothetical protein
LFKARQEIIAGSNQALLAIGVQFFERAMDGISQMQFDGSYERGNFVDVTKFILLRALLVRG